MITKAKDNERENAKDALFSAETVHRVFHFSENEWLQPQTSHWIDMHIQNIQRGMGSGGGDSDGKRKYRRHFTHSVYIKVGIIARMNTNSPPRWLALSLTDAHSNWKKGYLCD